MGNEKARKIWLDKFADIKGLYPNAKNSLEFQEHLHEKYILKRFYADSDKVSTKDNSYQSSKSCEIKKTQSQSAINSSNNSMNNSTIFNDNDFKFDSQSETLKPSKFKKIQSSSEIVSALKIETNSMSFANKPKSIISFPLTTRKSDNSIVSSSLISQPIIKTDRNLLEKSFDFSHINNSLLTKTVSPNVNNTTVTTTSSGNSNGNFPFTHDFTKSAKMMDDLTTLYSGYTAEKKVDPLDKLFYQYNFSSGNHMRMNANSNMRPNDNSHQVPFYNNQNVYNRGHLDSIYGINSQH